MGRGECVPFVGANQRDQLTKKQVRQEEKSFSFVFW